jgi:hypothetical protein
MKIRNSTPKQGFEINSKNDYGGNKPQEIFERFWHIFHDFYTGFDDRGVDWIQLFNTYRPTIDDKTNSEDLLQIFKKMLAPLDDANVELFVNDHGIFNSNAIINRGIDDELFQLELIKSAYLDSESIVDGNDFLSGRIINSEIKYLYAYEDCSDKADLAMAWEDLSSFKRLIIDLRHSSGGAFSAGSHEIGRFIKGKKFILRSKNKIGVNKYSEWEEWLLAPGVDSYANRLVLLTDVYTRGIAERIVLTLSSKENVTVIGGVTNGSYSATITKKINNSIYCTISHQLLDFHKSVIVEGKGIYPDVFVKNQLSEMNNFQDKTLERALKEFD